MQAIQTVYKGPTNTRGSGVTVRAERGRKRYGWNHAADIGDNHRNAAAMCAAEWEWTGVWVGGSTPDGTGYTFACIGDDPQAWAWFHNGSRGVPAFGVGRYTDGAVKAQVFAANGDVVRL